MNPFAIQFAGWTDKRGNTWKGGVGKQAEPGWLFSETVRGTICLEGGRWACYRLFAQTIPCAVFDALHDAADFMVEGPA